MRVFFRLLLSVEGQIGIISMDRMIKSITVMSHVAFFFIGACTAAGPKYLTMDFQLTREQQDIKKAASRTCP